MTDETGAGEQAGPLNEVAEEDARLATLNAAMARYDACVDPVAGQFSHSLLVNGHNLRTALAAVRAGLVAALSYNGPEADAPASRDETHASIDEHGAPTPQALAAQAAMGVSSAAAGDAKVAADLAGEPEPEAPLSEVGHADPDPQPDADPPAEEPAP